LCRFYTMSPAARKIKQEGSAMTTLITPYQVPEWVQGKMLGSSDAQGWHGVIQRSYQLEAWEVAAPAIDHYTIMLQRSNKPAALQRRCAGEWQRHTFSPGDISLLSIAQPAHWRWQESLDVSHIYLSRELLLNVSREVTGRNVSEVRLHDLLAIRDPVLTSIALAITAEAQIPAAGGAIYAEALATQMAVHLLRHYSNLEFQADRASLKLDGARMRKLHAYVQAHLEGPLSIANLADQVNMGVWAFSRAFKEATGCPPHLYIVNERVKRAQTLLGSVALPLKEIALQCGFSDQAHMSRLLRARLGVTPGQLQRSALKSVAADRIT
jgi:AraC family transcriptional regulator